MFFMQPKLLTPAEAARLKGVSRAAIYAAIADGRLPHSRVLGRLALQESDVQAWTPRQDVGRPVGMTLGEDIRARISASQKQSWNRRKQANQVSDPVESQGNSDEM